MSNLKWKPKNDFVGVPDKGFIPASQFSEEDQDAMIKRAKNRKMDVHSFMLTNGLVPVQAQVELDLEVPEKEGVEEASFEEPKAEKVKKEKVKKEKPTE